jgi:hypothetical protein
LPTGTFGKTGANQIQSLHCSKLQL